MDFRIALGGPSSNAFTAEVLAGCGPAVAKRLSALVAEEGSARLRVPAGQVPGGRVVGWPQRRTCAAPVTSPVLIVAAADPAGLDAAMAELARDLMDQRLPASTCESGVLAPGDVPLADGAVALYNQGTPSGAVTPDGTLWMSLFRACSGWPSGVWIDGDRRTAPDGSSFAWQHWSHVFRYALASSGAGGDWRSAGFSAAAEDFNHELTAVVTTAAAGSGGAPHAGSGGAGCRGYGLVCVLTCAPNVTLSSAAAGGQSPGRRTGLAARPGPRAR